MMMDDGKDRKFIEGEEENKGERNSTICKNKGN